MSTEDAGKVLADLGTMAAAVDSLMAPLVAELQEMLDGLAGRSFGSLEANQAVARQLVVLLNRLGMRVECPRCGQPATLRCAPMRGMREGAFKFEHYSQGRPTHHRASPVLPALRLVPRPVEPRQMGLVK